MDGFWIGPVGRAGRNLSPVPMSQMGEQCHSGCHKLSPESYGDRREWVEAQHPKLHHYLHSCH